MKTVLLEKNDPKYLRRLVKELRKYQFDGFFDSEGIRYTDAETHFGTMRCYCKGNWIVLPIDSKFFDYNGAEIVASREP